MVTIAPPGHLPQLSARQFLIPTHSVYALMLRRKLTHSINPASPSKIFDNANKLRGEELIACHASLIPRVQSKLLIDDAIKVPSLNLVFKGFDTLKRSQLNCKQALITTPGSKANVPVTRIDAHPTKWTLSHVPSPTYSVKPQEKPSAQHQATEQHQIGHGTQPRNAPA